MLGPKPALTGKTQLSSDAVVLDVPFESQKAADLCGIAVLNMLTEYYGKKLDPDQAAILFREAKEKGGVSGASLKEALKVSGYTAVIFPGSLERGTAGLYDHLDRKRPLIVMVGGGQRHYLVVIGYDSERENLVVLDPAKGRHIFPLEAFSEEWRKANNFTLLATPN
ncbi:MAG: cysteine peptidase family C39 domain-containing protein [candidate division FCPU426 bacterium]